MQAEVRKGTDTTPGAADPLPQGGAKQVNDAMAAAPEMPMMQAAPSPEYAPPNYDPTAGVKHTNEDDQILFGDPAQPRPVTAPSKQMQRVPTRVVRHLPMMRMMLEDPEAPESLRALYRLIVTHLEQENG